jgi:predicted RNA-binding Zn ribbon-like protein
MAPVVIDYPGPMLGEPLPLELANTRYLARGHARDGLDSVELLGAWLARVRSRLSTPPSDEDLLTIGDAQLALVRDLRHCVRGLAEAIVDHRGADAEVVDRLNHHVRAVPRWAELRWDERDEHPRAQACTNAAPVAASVGEIAAAAVELFAGPSGADIRQCGAPNCILYFVKDHARREWCSAACGNRVRAARHYRRRRQEHGRSEAAEARVVP